MKFVTCTTILLAFPYFNSLVLSKDVAVPAIINGGIPARGRWPWQASLTRYRYHVCGAVLLSRNYVLTAAHCVKRPLRAYRVVLGTNNLKAPNQTLRISKVFKHPLFKRWRGIQPNDISVLRLSRPAAFNRLVQPASLHDSHDSLKSWQCMMTGWGRTRYKPPKWTFLLKQAHAYVISNSLCGWMTKNIKKGKIYNSNVCVIGHRRSTACQGDSGGPLNCRYNRSQPWVVAGLMSWTVKGCKTNYPSVYTRVSSYITWITGIIGGQGRSTPAPVSSTQLLPNFNVTYSRTPQSKTIITTKEFLSVDINNVTTNPPLLKNTKLYLTNKALAKWHTIMTNTSAIKPGPVDKAGQLSAGMTTSPGVNHFKQKPALTSGLTVIPKEISTPKNFTQAYSVSPNPLAHGETDVYNIRGLRSNKTFLLAEKSDDRWRGGESAGSSASESKGELARRRKVSLSAAGSKPPKNSHRSFTVASQEDKITEMMSFPAATVTGKYQNSKGKILQFIDNKSETTESQFAHDSTNVVSTVRFYSFWSDWRTIILCISVPVVAAVTAAGMLIYFQQRNKKNIHFVPTEGSWIQLERIN